MLTRDVLIWQIGTLPSVISYSPLHVPSVVPHMPVTNLAKRDLFDARFQLISASTSTLTSNDPQGVVSIGDLASEADLRYVEAPSDLVPGVYEGGLKTWECSIDLAGSVKDRFSFFATHKDDLRVLEVTIA
jgi:protein-histidine N-methyltransferase